MKCANIWHSQEVGSECCIFSENLKGVNFEDGDTWEEIIKQILKEKGFRV